MYVLMSECMYLSLYVRKDVSLHVRREINSSVCMSIVVCVCMYAVSYTHLTLPTMFEV